MVMISQDLSNSPPESDLRGSDRGQGRYQPLYKPNQLICGEGQIAVITGWTVKQAVAQRVQPTHYAVIGQLYSPTRGISVLVRNLVANPQVRYLVVLQATREDRNAGACECLLDLFRHGVTEGISDTGRPCWQIASPILGYVDIEIPRAVVEQLRVALEVHEARSIGGAVELIQTLSARSPLPVWGEPRTFPLPDLTPQVLPGPRYGHRIEGRTIAETWVQIIHRIKTTGTIRPTGYDGHWQELIDLLAVVTDEPPGFYFPEPNYLPCDRPFIEGYISQILDDAPYQEGVKYTYGQRLRSWFGRDQIEQVIQKLIREIDAASGVMSLWDVGDHDAGGSPCLNHIWIRVVQGELSLTALFRSNDMFSAWPANAMGLRALQIHIRDQIAARSDHRLTLGPLITLSQSAHIYDDCWENAEHLIAHQYARLCGDRDYHDPVGNFVIEVEGSELVVTRTTPGSGEIVQTFRGRHPLKLARQIAADTPGIQPDHGLYLGIELQKAATALHTGVPYCQDR